MCRGARFCRTVGSIFVFDPHRCSAWHGLRLYSFGSNGVQLFQADAVRVGCVVYAAVIGRYFCDFVGVSLGTRQALPDRRRGVRLFDVPLYPRARFCAPLFTSFHSVETLFCGGIKFF